MKTESPDNSTLKDINTELEKAITAKNKRLILHLYDKVDDIDFKFVDDEVADKYDSLLDQANEILYDK